MKLKDGTERKASIIADAVFFTWESASDALRSYRAGVHTTVTTPDAVLEAGKLAQRNPKQIAVDDFANECVPIRRRVEAHGA